MSDLSLTDQEMKDLRAAVYDYQRSCWRFAVDISRASYEKQDGTFPTKADRRQAMDRAARLDKLVERVGVIQEGDRE